MMVAFSKSDRHEECLEYWRQLVCVNGIGDVRINLETYHCAIKSAVVMCQWDEVGAILDVMKVRREARSDAGIKVVASAAVAASSREWKGPAESAFVTL